MCPFQRLFVSMLMWFISPPHQLQEEDRHRVSVSIAGREVHVSVSGSVTGSSSMAYPMLLDNGTVDPVEDSDYSN